MHTECDYFSRRSIPAWAGEPSRRLAASSRLQVYPRVGGGTWCNCLGGLSLAGLSPRGRGNHDSGLRVVSTPMSIPAWAGEPCCVGLAWYVLRVYPRVGGGTRRPSVRTVRQRGLSPRGRGNPPEVCTRRNELRSIPAWAGEPLPCATSETADWVYPRVGGGTCVICGAIPDAGGLSPRGRGNLSPEH